MKTSKTIVITAAGIGSRLGFDMPKCLLELHGKPIIKWQLEMLKEYDDIRIVVGYKATDVINTVLEVRNDITFVFNHNYKTTNTLNSLYLGAKYGRNMILSLDGDLLVHPEDLQKFANRSEECIGITTERTEEPVLVTTSVTIKPNTVKQPDSQVKNIWAENFSRDNGNFEWTGLVLIKQNKIKNQNSYIYELLEKYLPMKAILIRCCEIDTHNDYMKALKWVEKYLVV